MQADEIRELGAADIEARIRELEEERFRLRFRSATEPLEQPLRLRVIRKDIARLNTILREKRVEGKGKRKTGTTTAKGAAAKSATSAKAGKKTAAR
jgi:large subunit ribosomal protein L29